MAELGKPLPTPDVGVRGNPESLQVLQRHQGLEGGGSIPNFGAALTALATTPTALGEIGSSLMTNSSIALATRWGQELGKEPKGNLLPSITKFDQNVENAYYTQSQVTLSNNATAMMLNAQDEMAKADKLTPGMIQSYAANMTKGLQQTLEMAPDKIRPELENQFRHQLLTTTSAYNEKLINQNKAQAESEAAVWRIHQNDLVTNMVKDGDFKNADASYEALRNNIEQSNLTPAQKETALTTAKLNYKSAISIQKVMEAREAGKEDEYLASIADKKIDGLTWSESEQVRDNTVKYLSAVETAENRDQTLQMSAAQLSMAQGTFDESSLANLRDTLRPENYNRVATQWAVSQHKAGVGNLVTQNIISHPQDATTYEGLTPKQINAGFDMLTRAIVQKSQANREEITMDEAEFRAASIMNTIVPKYIDRLNREMANGNPVQRLAGLESYERLHELDGNKVLGIDERALTAAEIFKNLLANQNPDINAASINANEIVFNKKDEIIKANNAAIHSFMMKNASTPQNRLSTAIKLSGVSSSNIDNQAAFQADTFSRFNGYMQLSNGDVEVSKARLQKDMSKLWGESRINGKVQTTKLGVEQAISLPTNAAPLIQEDVISQLIPQLEATKKLFESGGSPHYWRIKEGRIGYQEYAKAKLRKQKEGLNDAYYAVDSQLIKKFENAPAIEIEQVTKHGTYTWNLEIQSSPYVQRSPTTGQVSGYNLAVRHPETGEVGQLYGFYGATHTIPTYNPNAKWIRDNYIGVNNLRGMTPEEFIKAQLEHKNPESWIDQRGEAWRQPWIP